MPPEPIDLNRHAAPANEEQGGVGIPLGFPLTWTEARPLDEHIRTLGRSPATGTEPVQAKPIVLTAASEAGKTTELRLTAEKLRTRGEVVVEATAIEMLSGSEIDSVLAAAQQQALSCGSALYVLADAVDELYLANRTLSDLANACRALFPLRCETRLVFTSREDCWGERERSWLGQLARTVTNPRGQGAASEEAEGPGFHHLRLLPLDNQAISRLAVHLGLKPADVGEFKRALEGGGVTRLFETRPPDVNMLLQHWQEARAFSSWGSILRSFLRRTYGERNPARPPLKRLTLRQYELGLKKVAAITALGATRHLVKPGAAPVSGVPHAEDLFPDWTPDELFELFSSPIFVGKTPATVQLQQGQVSAYLAASWLTELAARGFSESAVVRSLLLVPEGHESATLVLSRRAVAGWAAPIIPTLRSALLAAAPDAVLFEGDPSETTDADMGRLLDAMSGDWVPSAFGGPSSGRLRQIARPSQSDTVIRLLSQRARSDETLIVLLRLAEAADIDRAVTPALVIAHDTRRDGSVRALAVRLVAKLGSDEQVRSLQALLNQPDHHVREELFRTLVPRHLKGKPLIDFLVAEQDGHLAALLEEVQLPLTKRELADAARRLLARLGPEATAQNRLNVSEEGSGLANVALELVVMRARLDSGPLPSVFNELVVSLEVLDNVFFYPEERVARVRELLTPLSKWRCVWKQRQVSNGTLSNTRSWLAPLTPEALCWLAESEPRPEPWLLRSYYIDLDDGNRQRARELCQRNAVARKLVDRIESEKREQEQARGKQRRQEARAQAARRAKHSKPWKSKLRHVRKGEAPQLLAEAFKMLRSSSGTSTNFSPVEEHFGVELAMAIREGFIAFWRSGGAEPYRPDGRRPLAARIALVGLTLELGRLAPEELSALKAEEAKRAATLAMYELNRLPRWFASLLDAHPKACEEAVEEAVSSEWQAAHAQVGVLQHVQHVRHAATQRVFFDALLTELERGAPSSAVTLISAAGVIGCQRTLPGWLPGTCKAGFGSACDDQWREGWLFMWASVDPAAAGKRLGSLKATNTASLVQRFARSCRWSLGPEPGPGRDRFFAAPALAEWLAVLFAVAPPDEGRKRRSARGQVEQLRDTCSRALQNDASIDATRVLAALQRHPDPQVRKRVAWIANEQRFAAAEKQAETWTVEKIVEAERRGLRLPETSAELWNVVREDLASVDRLMNANEFSYLALFRAAGAENVSERLIQLWIASSLKLLCGGVYSVVRENEDDKQNRVDISAFRASVGRVPIEIKPLRQKKGYSLAELENCIREQLVGKYMKQPDVTHGVLLLVNQDRERWRPKQRNVSVQQGVAELRRYADRFLMSHGKSIAVEVVDLR